jgi:hypothetical protein
MRSIQKSAPEGSYADKFITLNDVSRVIHEENIRLQPEDAKSTG